MADKLIKIRYDVETVDVEKADAIFKRIAASTDKADKGVDDLGNAFKKAGDKADDFGKKTDDGFKKPIGTIEKLRRQMIAFEKARDSSTDPKRIELLNRALDKAREKFKNLTTAAKQPEKPISNIAKASQLANTSVSKLGASLLAAFTVTALVGIGKKIFDITAEFQKFDAVLTNTLGSQKQAQGAMLEISDAAAKTNFSVQELTDNYIKFANRGVKLSQAELLKLADIANSTGKDFGQLSEAVLDAFTGENERLKEFGITAKKTGETTQFTFKGITTEVQNTQEAISKYLFGLAELNGVQGTTAGISQTLTGRVSNMEDAFDQLFLTIGRGTTGFLPGLISKFTDFVALMDLSFKSMKQLKEEASALNLSGDLREDIDEVKALADAYVKNGMTISEATKKAAADVSKSLENILNGWNVIGAEEEANLKERIANIRKTFKEQEKTANSELGLLEKLRAELKLVTEQREKATSEKEINGYNQRAKKLQIEIDRLLGVEKQAERTRIELQKLAGIDYTTGLTEFGQTLKGALSEIYEKLYGEQVSGAGKATEANEAQTEAFIDGVGRQIEARAGQYNRERELAAIRLKQEEEERAQRNQAISEGIEVAKGLYGSLVDYQNSLDEQRLNRLEINKERELIAAGENSKERARIELEYDQKIKSIRRKQAEREKRLAIFQAIINTAQGVTAALKLGIPGIILAALVAAAGAVQIAAISNQQIPEYAKGTKSVPGKGNKDTEHALLTPGEMVIPKTTAKKYRPVLDKIFDNKIDPRILNQVAQGKTGGSMMVVNDNKEVVEAIKKLPVDRISMDEDGFKVYLEKGRSRTQYLQKRYSSR